MEPHIIRYTVKPEQVAQHEELLGALFAELEEAEPAGLRYEAFRLGDGVSYVHLVRMDKGEGHGGLPHLTALRAFHAGLRERCDAAPERDELSPIGAFGS